MSPCGTHVDTVLRFTAKCSSTQLLQLLSKPIEDLSGASLRAVFSQMEDHQDSFRYMFGDTEKDLDSLCTTPQFYHENDWQQCNEEITAADVVGSLSEIYRPSLSTFEAQAGVSFLRDNIVSHIEENGYRRPSYNRLRNDGLNFEVYERHHLM